jgi:hypothetical protein
MRHHLLFYGQPPPAPEDSSAPETADSAAVSAAARLESVRVEEVRQCYPPGLQHLPLNCARFKQYI